MAMQKFFVGVKGVIVKDGKILLLRRETDVHYWDVPGGRIDDKETFTEALDRELHEELPNITSYKIGPLLSAGRLFHNIKDDVSLTLLFFRVDEATFDGEPAVSEEHVRAQWMTAEEALSDPDVLDGLEPILKDMK